MRFDAYSRIYHLNVSARTEWACTSGVARWALHVRICCCFDIFSVWRKIKQKQLSSFWLPPQANRAELIPSQKLQKHNIKELQLPKQKWRNFFHEFRKPMTDCLKRAGVVRLSCIFSGSDKFAWHFFENENLWREDNRIVSVWQCSRTLRPVCQAFGHLTANSNSQI